MRMSSPSTISREMSLAFSMKSLPSHSKLPECEVAVRGNHPNAQQRLPSLFPRTSFRSMLASCISSSPFRSWAIRTWSSSSLISSAVSTKLILASMGRQWMISQTGDQKEDNTIPLPGNQAAFIRKPALQWRQLSHTISAPLIWQGNLSTAWTSEYSLTITDRSFPAC